MVWNSYHVKNNIRNNDENSYSLTGLLQKDNDLVSHDLSQVPRSAKHALHLFSLASQQYGTFVFVDFFSP